MTTARRIALAAMAALFLFSAAVQVNDPDPLGWMAIYLAAAALSALRLAGRGGRALPAVVALTALVWAAAIVPGARGRTTLREAFGQVGMANEPAEVARETLGLLLVAAGMTLLAATAHSQRAR